MATKHYSAENLQRIPLQGLRLENLSSAPASAQPGEIYFDVVLGWARVCLSATGPVWLELKEITAAALADLATVVKAYRLDEFATPTTDLDLGGHRAIDAADPSGATDLTTRQWVEAYVAARINGLDWKASVRVVATADVNIASPAASIDGVTLTAGDRVLLAGQSTASQNGLYTYGATLTRTTDADSSAEVTANLAVIVAEGTTYHDTVWQLSTNDAIVLGTTALTFTQFGTGTAYTASSPLSMVGTDVQLGTVPIAYGGTAATTAAGARTGLGVAQKGFAADVGAMTAGVGLNIAHGLGTADLTVQVRLNSTGQLYEFDINVDSTNITITSQIATTAAQFRVVATPVV